MHSFTFAWTHDERLLLLVMHRSAGEALLIIIIDHGESWGMRIRNRFWGHFSCQEWGRVRERGRAGEGDTMWLLWNARFNGYRMPHATCPRGLPRLPPWAIEISMDFGQKVQIAWTFFLVFQIDQNRTDQRPESRAARPNWTAGCPFFGQHDQVARFVYPEGDQGPDDDATAAPALSSSLAVLSFSACLLAGAFASVLVANQKSKSLLALATKRDAVGNADDDLLPLHAPCRMAFRRLYKLGQSTKWLTTRLPDE